LVKALVKLGELAEAQRVANLMEYSEGEQAQELLGTAYVAAGSATANWLRRLEDSQSKPPCPLGFAYFVDLPGSMAGAAKKPEARNVFSEMTQIAGKVARTQARMFLLVEQQSGQ
jgi:hypothetical protein